MRKCGEAPRGGGGARGVCGGGGVLSRWADSHDVMRWGWLVGEPSALYMCVGVHADPSSHLPWPLHVCCCRRRCGCCSDGSGGARLSLSVSLCRLNFCALHIVTPLPSNSEGDTRRTATNSHTHTHSHTCTYFRYAQACCAKLPHISVGLCSFVCEPSERERDVDDAASS